MSKKSLHVGLNNYPGSGNDLMGCVNDAKAMASLLTEHYDFATSDVRLLLDQEATKANILDGVKTLLTGAKSRDVLVFTNSSHGTYQMDTSADERYDEAICPYDLRENLLLDDELREIFAAVPTGVRLTVISDSCFSGTVTRALLREILPGLVHDDDERRVRFLHPMWTAAYRADDALTREVTFLNPWIAKPKRMTYPQASMKHLLLSGATDEEYAYDARFSGVYYGAMTYAALHIIRQANYQITYRALTEQMNAWLDITGFPQHPQLEGPSQWKRRQIFV